MIRVVVFGVPRFLIRFNKIDVLQLFALRSRRSFTEVYTDFIMKKEVKKYLMFTIEHFFHFSETRQGSIS